MSRGEKRENRQVWTEKEWGLKGGRGKWHVEGWGFDGDGKRKKGGSFSESDCTVRGGGVYPANRAHEGKANYSLQLQKQQ